MNTAPTVINSRKSLALPAAEPAFHKKRRIFYRTALMAWTLVVSTVLIFLGVTIPPQRQQLLDEMRQRGKVVFTSTAQVAVESIVLEDYSAFVEYCINLIAKNPSIEYVVLTRKDGFSLVHTRTYWKQEQLDGMWRPAPGQADTTGSFMDHSFSDGKVFHMTFPLSYSGIDWGWIHLGLSPNKFYRDLNALYKRTFLVAMVAILGGLIGSFLYARRLSIPIQRLERFSKQIAAGDLTERIHIQTGDELQTLADSFNHMVGELNRSKQVLVESARQAGMAEMSVNVLHNVGNVLNSVGVTIHTLKERVRKSKMLSLAPMATLLEEQGNHLAEFISQDPRGRKTTTFLSALGTHLEEDQRSLIDDLASLERHVQHIQDIVQLQQTYSRAAGLTERVDVADVIEDALALNMDGILKQGITVQKDLAPLPRTILDRYKLLQILINLISNAKQAVAPVDRTDKRIGICMDQPAPEILRISVTDNGMGISQENLTRIFQHGFTTRREGHGFGLHSSAIAALEMNGSLRVESRGSGLGAAFTLELPFRASLKATNG
jgi:signal transduction histidine kinase